MEKEAFVFKYRNNLYSKISTNPLWNDILAGLLIYTKANENQLHKAWPDIRPESKFALYSAHDTTIMSLLASLGSIVYDNAGLWPPYASMVNIELFEIKKTMHHHNYKLNIQLGWHSDCYTMERLLHNMFQDV